MTIKIVLSTGKEIELTGEELKELYGNSQTINPWIIPQYPQYPIQPYWYPTVMYKLTC